MENNRRTAGKLHYTLPSPDSYPYQWLWDSCFHAIILSHFDLEIAKEELRALVVRQFKNGMIPHMSYWEPHQDTFTRIQWGKRHTSSITQPPMLPVAALRIYQVDSDKAFLKELFEPMKRFMDFFLNERDPHHHNLVGIINPDESGEDNSPRFDTVLHLAPQHRWEENFKRRLELVEQNRICKFQTACMENFSWVRDVPINAIFVENLRRLSDIALILGDQPQAELRAQQAEAVAAAMRRYMLHDGIMYATNGHNYHRIPVKTWALFAPLYAQIYTPDEARDIINKHFNNPKEFKSIYQLPTVAMDEPAFNPAGFASGPDWRGTVWMASNWFVYQGLKHYGYDDEASAIAEASRHLIKKSGFREQYNPLSGEGNGAHNFTWGGLVLDMI